MNDKSLYLHPAKKKRMGRPEQIIQIGIMGRLVPRMLLTKQFLVLAIPNSGYRTPAEAGIMRAMGQMAGASDFLLGFPPNKISINDFFVETTGRTVWVELKVRKMVLCKKGPDKGKMVEKRTKLTPEQEAFRALVKSLGFDHREIYALDVNDGLNKCLEILKEYGVES